MNGEVPLRDPLAWSGRVETRTYESALLKDNPAGDPHRREVPVYLPPGWQAAGARFPVIFLLCGFSGRATGFCDTHPWHPGAVWQYDRDLARDAAEPAILVMPDAWTALGGSQYVDSARNGPYERYLVEELVGWVDAHYPSLPGRRGVAGKSSGGFGALWLGMRHPEVFPAVASISGDCQFEYCYGGEILGALRGLVPHGMDPAVFLEAFREDPRLEGDAHAVINVLAMASCYSPNPDSPLGFDLPMDLETGERVETVWRRWLEFDPVVAAPRHAEGLRKLELLHLECGLRDEFHLQWGLRILCRVLRELGVEFDHLEHEGGHMGIGHRYAPVIAKLAGHLAG